MSVVDDPQLSAQFGRFLRLLCYTALAFGSFDLAIGWYLGAPALIVVSAITFGFGIISLISYFLLRRGALHGAVALTCGSFLVTPLLFTLALRSLFPVAIFFIVAACSLPMLLRSRQVFIGVGIGALLTAILLPATQLLPELLPPPPASVVFPLLGTVIPVCTILMLLLFYFIWQSLLRIVAQTAAVNVELTALRGTLEAQVVQRTAALTAALAEGEQRTERQRLLLEENQQQRQIIRQLSLPVLPISQSTLVVPLVGALDAARIDDMIASALAAISTSSARYLVLDVTGVPVIDTAVAQGLMHVFEAASLLGAQVLLVGVRPEVAQTIVGLGIGLTGLQTHSTLQAALAAIEQRTVALERMIDVAP